MAFDARATCTFIELSARIAGEFRAMTTVQQSQGQSEYLRFAAGKTQLRIDTQDPQRRIACRIIMRKVPRAVIHFYRGIHLIVASIEKPVIKDRPNRGYRIAPADFLAFLVGASRI